MALKEDQRLGLNDTAVLIVVLGYWRFKPTIGYDRKEALETGRWKTRILQKKGSDRSALGRENISFKGGIEMIEKNKGLEIELTARNK